MSIYDKILAEARTIKAANPTISSDELRQQLKAKFETRRSYPSGTVVGAASNPLDWFYGLSDIFKGIAKIWEGDAHGITHMITGVVRIVFEEN